MAVILTEAEYEDTAGRVEEYRAIIEAERAALTTEGLKPDEVERAVEPLLSFRAQLEEQIEWYRRVRKNDLRDIHGLAHIGRLLIAARISGGRTQRELAAALGLSESVVSRDERNEYHGIAATTIPIPQGRVVVSALSVEEPMVHQGSLRLRFVAYITQANRHGTTTVILSADDNEGATVSIETATTGIFEEASCVRVRQPQAGRVRLRVLVRTRGHEWSSEPVLFPSAGVAAE